MAELNTSYTAQSNFEGTTCSSNLLGHDWVNWQALPLDVKVHLGWKEERQADAQRKQGDFRKSPSSSMGPAIRRDAGEEDVQNALLTGRHRRVESSRETALSTGIATDVSPGVIQDLLPGTIHPSHHTLQTERYTFCGVCGVYGKQLRRSRLHLPCPWRPRTRDANRARCMLLSGFEPEGTGWRKSASPVCSYEAD